MSKEILTISDPFDGYFNGVPYTVDEYRQDMYFEISSEEIDKARDIKNVTDKLVYMLLLALSDGTAEHFGNMLFIDIGIEQIAAILGLDLDDTIKSVDRLVSTEKLLIMRDDEGYAYYAAV